MVQEEGEGATESRQSLSIREEPEVHGGSRGGASNNSSAVMSCEASTKCYDSSSHDNNADDNGVRNFCCISHVIRGLGKHHGINEDKILIYLLMFREGQSFILAVSIIMICM